MAHLTINAYISVYVCVYACMNLCINGLDTFHKTFNFNFNYIRVECLALVRNSKPNIFSNSSMNF